MLTCVRDWRSIRHRGKKCVREEVTIFTVRMRFFHLSIVVSLAELRLMLVRMVPEMQTSAVLMLAIRGRS